jgi:hypothetical protein
VGHQTPGTRKTGWQPGLPIHRRRWRRTKSVRRILVGLWTDIKPVLGVCVLVSWQSATASSGPSGAGDGLPPHVRPVRSAPVSYTAIAAAIALGDVSPSERLVAFSLASYANRDGTAYPGNPAAAARAGLSRSRYLHARDQLVRRGLISVTDAGGGRGRSATIVLSFANAGLRVSGPVNAQLFEAVLGYSTAQGSARQLLAAMAAMSAEDGSLIDVTTDEIRAAAGLADSTYRRARAALVESGELLLEHGGGGRGLTNHWRIQDPRTSAMPPARRRPSRREAPPATARPLVASIPAPANAGVAQDAAQPVVAKGPDLSGASPAGNTAQSRTVSTVKGPGLSGVTTRNTAQTRTVSQPKTPPKTQPKTPPPYVRAGSNALNPKTQNPPQPPLEGGSPPAAVTIIEHYVTHRGRHRPRTVTVDLDTARSELLEATGADRSDWQQARAELHRIVGESTFEIWLAPLELLAIDPTGCLLLSAPPATRAWVAARFGRAFERTGQSVGRELMLATDRELQLHRALSTTTADGARRSSSLQRPDDQQEAV